MDRKYRTFWERFAASLIDGVVLGPVGYPTTILIGYGPRAVAIAWVLVTFPAAWAYTSYCHGRWGKTLGKHALGILVVRSEDESRLGYVRAIRRDAGAIVLSVFGTAMLVGFLLGDGDTDAFRVFDQDRVEFTDEEIENGDAGELFRKAFSESFPPWQLMIMPAMSLIWSIAELATMLSNPRRRAIHDLIGGSVVIKAKALKPAVESTPSP